MVELVFTKDIHAPAQAVFDLIADLQHYDKWLSSEGIFGSLVGISDDPIKLGTTYVDKGSNSTLTGKVVVFEPPNQIGFSQGQIFKAGIPLGQLHIEMRYVLTETSGNTHVKRTINVTTSGLLWLTQPILIRSISQENVRILARMKVYLEGVHE